MSPLLIDALGKVERGLTTLEEVQFNIPYNQILRYRNGLQTARSGHDKPAGRPPPRE